MKTRLSRSALEALKYELTSPERARKVIKRVIRVAEDSAQQDLLNLTLEVLDAFENDTRRWTARKRLVDLARLSLKMADREEET